MQFRLVFEGELRPRRQVNLDDIHKIRMALHLQLKELWEHSPFLDVQSWRDPPETATSFTARTNIGGLTFISAVSSRAFVYAELEILFLRQQAPGVLISKQGDLDNRIKTLFDALRVPSRNEVRDLSEEHQSQLQEYKEIFCLLEDDHLVTKVSVATDRWLGQPPHSKNTLAVIQVHLKASKLTLGNLSIVA